MRGVGEDSTTLQSGKSRIVANGRLPIYLLLVGKAGVLLSMDTLTVDLQSWTCTTWPAMSAT